MPIRLALAKKSGSLPGVSSFMPRLGLVVEIGGWSCSLKYASLVETMLMARRMAGGLSLRNIKEISAKTLAGISFAEPSKRNHKKPEAEAPQAEADLPTTKSKPQPTTSAAARKRVAKAAAAAAAAANGPH